MKPQHYITACLLLLSGLRIDAQNWQLGGNAAPVLTAGNNYLGSGGTTNLPLKIGTFGINRLFIQNNTGPTAGFVGIGTNFSAPQSMLHIHDGFSSSFQMTNFFTGATANNGFRILVNLTTTALMQQEAAPFLFYAGGNSTANLSMMIQGTAGSTQGFIGMGSGFTNPQSLLHLHQPTGNVFLRFTNNGTGSTNLDGFVVGVLNGTANGDAAIIQYEPNPIHLYQPDINVVGSPTYEKMQFTYGGQMSGGNSRWIADI